MEKVLVTGGAGFVGHHLVGGLLAKGYAVNILDDLSSGYRENLHPEAHFIEGDIRDPLAVSEAMEGCSKVFHLAARVELQKSIVDPADCMSVNVAGTAQIVQECLKEKGRRLVFASSCAVYPIHPKGPLSEDMATPGETPYALSKRSGEETINIFAKLKGLNACSLRCFNIYGPRQRPDSQYAAVIPKFISLAREGKPLTINGDGSQTRDFIYVDDIVACYLLAAETDVTGVFNAGTGTETSVLELAQKINAINGGGEILHKPALAGDASASRSNPKNAEVALKFFPEYSLDKGLRATVGNYGKK